MPRSQIPLPRSVLWWDGLPASHSTHEHDRGLPQQGGTCLSGCKRETLAKSVTGRGGVSRLHPPRHVLPLLWVPRMALSFPAHVRVPSACVCSSAFSPSVPNVVGYSGKASADPGIGNLLTWPVTGWGALHDSGCSKACNISVHTQERTGPLPGRAFCGPLSLPCPG